MSSNPRLPVTRDSVVRSVLSATQCRVQGLEVTVSDDSITVSGLSRTWYVKQLVTQALRALPPTLRLQNDIRVCAN